MAKFLDGPARGQRLNLRTCPTLLRVVLNTRTGEWNALDQPEDEPEPDEHCFAYRSVPGTWTFMFIRPGGRYEYAQYTLLPKVPQEVMRTRTDWIDWIEGNIDLEPLQHTD